MIDTLFVKPNSSLPAGVFSAIEPPFWAAMMANAYRNQGKEIAILDAEVDNLSVQDTVSEVESFRPQEVIIVVMGNNPSVSSTPKMPAATIVAGALIKEGYNVKITGLHPMALPEHTKETTGCDVVDWHPSPGSSPLYDVIDLSKYRAHNWHCLGDLENRSPYAVVATSFGCPFACEYCNIHVLYESKVCYRPIELILEDLAYVANKQKVRNIKFWDECFTLNHVRAKTLCKAIIAKKWDLNIWAYARPDTVDAELLSLMKQAGINWLAYGLDDKCDSEVITKAIALTHEAGIHIIGNFLFGLSSNNGDSNVAEVAESLDIEWANFYTALPYPGSPWYDKAKASKDWVEYNQYGTGCHPLRDKAFYHFFSRPSYPDMIRTKFGDKAVVHIKQMLNLNIREAQYGSLHR